jgi:hypothetical protein
MSEQGIIQVVTLIVTTVGACFGLWIKRDSGAINKKQDDIGEQVEGVKKDIKEQTIEALVDAKVNERMEREITKALQAERARVAARAAATKGE